MSNPWQELFEDIRFENGNDYFYQSLNEEEEGRVSSALVNSAVQKIKRIAKRDNVRIQVAMTTFFSNTRLSPSERAAIRNKIAEFGESLEVDELEVIQEKITAKTDIGAAIRDFRKSKSPQLAGRTKEERRKAAIAAVLQARRKSQNECFEIVAEKLADKDYDGDGTLETSKKEYLDNKKNVITKAIEAEKEKKKVLKNSFSDWRNDFDFIDEKRYSESPFVEVMPEQKASGDEDKKAANLRLKPKKSNVSEEIELANQLAENLGGTLIFEGVPSPKDVFQGLQYATKAAPAISNALKQALSRPPAGALAVVTPKAITAPKIVDAATKLLPAAKVTRTVTKAAPASKTASVSKSLTQPKNSPVLVDPVTGVITKTPKGTKSKTAPLATVSLPKPETLTKVEKRNRNKTIAALRDGRGGGGSTGTPGPGSGFGPTRGSGNIPIPSPPKSGEGRIYQAISL